MRKTRFCGFHMPTNCNVSLSPKCYLYTPRMDHTPGCPPTPLARPSGTSMGQKKMSSPPCVHGCCRGSWNHWTLGYPILDTVLVVLPPPSTRPINPHHFPWCIPNSCPYAQGIVRPSRVLNSWKIFPCVTWSTRDTLWGAAKEQFCTQLTEIYIPPNTHNFTFWRPTRTIN